MLLVSLTCLASVLLAALLAYEPPRRAQLPPLPLTQQNIQQPATPRLPVRVIDPSASTDFVRLLASALSSSANQRDDDVVVFGPVNKFYVVNDDDVSPPMTITVQIKHDDACRGNKAAVKSTASRTFVARCAAGEDKECANAVAQHLVTTYRDVARTWTSRGKPPPFANKHHFHVSFSVVASNAASPATYDKALVVKNYLQPLVEDLSFAHLRLTYDVTTLVGASVDASLVKTNGTHRYVPRGKRAVVVDASWRLFASSPSASPDSKRSLPSPVDGCEDFSSCVPPGRHTTTPTINLIVIAGEPTESPLLFETSTKELAPSFRLTGYGGVSSVVVGADGVITPASMHAAVQRLASHVRLHLGLPARTPGGRWEGAPPMSGIALFEADAIALHKRVVEYEHARRTLDDVRELVAGFPGSAVSDSAAATLKDAEAWLEAGTQVLLRLEDLEKATLSEVAQAERRASLYVSLGHLQSMAASFHPDAISDLYKPLEHKVAVLLPYFFPTLLPIAVSVAKAMSRKRKGEKQL
ncbi:hypothetical protein PPROV_000729300 [Pycnococcus provasolii]|uniref:GPI transamidase component PIG-S n=1 Tax=Pycnococcus provasolii TaxID=41880 RepID=A0A830HMB3_9CHLO|nr:hypothetical protein PPROV_000729300 [Pycnococcus provasolii]